MIHQAWYWLDTDSRTDTPLRAWVDQVRDKDVDENAVGNYECLWTIERRGVSAQLTVNPAKP